MELKDKVIEEIKKYMIQRFSEYLRTWSNI